jgi:hypothetical protein
VLPARHRPKGQSETLVGFGYHTLWELARESLADSSPGAVWERLWCTPWLSATLENLARVTDPASVTGIEDAALQQRFHAVALGLASQAVAPPFVDRTPLAPNEAATAWREALAAKVQGEPVVGVLAIGPLAAVRLPGGVRLGQQLVPRGLQAMCLTEGVELPRGLTALGAALYGKRRLHDEPTYLDTLPRLRTVVRTMGEPTWLDLLPEDTQFVPGGRVWRRPERVQNLSIAERQSLLTLTVHHEDYPSVREVAAKLEDPLPQRERVELDVEMEPAQGNARITVVPTRPDAFGGKPVIVHWRSAKESRDPETDGPMSPERYLLTLERVFPSLNPRFGSVDRWRNARRLMQAYLDHEQGGYARHAPALEEVIRALQQKDARHYPKDYTAIGADGQPPGDRAPFDAFVEHCLQSLTDASAAQRERYYRALGYMSVDDKRLEKALVRELDKVATDDVVKACGGCLRSPASIAKFLERFLARLRVSSTNSNIWLRALSQLLQYRGDATAETHSSTCEQLTVEMLTLFDTELKKGKGNYIFRYTSLAIVYLLRRRAYDDDYLAPESPTAIAAKDAFARAIQLRRQHRFRLMGGSVDLGAALQNMIDYIDRRGRGDILIGD